MPVLIGGVDEALGPCCSGSQRRESAEVREWHNSLTWGRHSLWRKRASLTAEVRSSSRRLGALFALSPQLPAAPPGWKNDLILPETPSKWEPARALAPVLARR